MDTADAPDIVKEYLEAFEARDLERCMALYDEGATLEFGPGTYQGREQLEEWHEARFAAELKILHIDDVKVEGNTITVQAIITSKRLKLWHLNQTKASAKFQVRDGKIADLRFAARLGNPHELVRLWKK